MKGRALDERCAVCGMPCHKYIIRNLTSELEMLEFERSYIDLMLFHEYTESEIETALMSFSTQIPQDSPISGKSFTIQGGGADFGSFVTSVAYDTTIPTYSKCTSFYKKYDNQTHACLLCEFSGRYSCRSKPIELKLTRYLLESEERYNNLIAGGLSSKDFKAQVDVMEYASSKRSYPFSLYRQIVQFMEKPEIREEQYGRRAVCAKMRVSLRERLKKMRLPEQFQGKEWLDRLISVWEFEIYKTPLIDNAEATELLLQLKNNVEQPVKRKSVPRQTSLADPGLFGFSGMSATEQNPVTEEFLEDVSEALHRSTASQMSNTPISEKEQLPKKAKEELSPQTDSCERNSALESSGDAPVFSKEESSSSSDEILSSGGHVGTSLSIPENNICQGTFIKTEHKDDGSHYRIVHDVEVLVPDEVLDPDEDKVSSYDIDLGLQDDIPPAPGALDMGGNYIYCGYISPVALDEIVCLDQRNARMLSDFETSVVKNGFLAFEVCEEIESHNRLILFWEPNAQRFYYTKLADTMVLEIVGALFSASSIRKISYSPYPIYSLMKANGMVVKNLECLQTRHYSFSQGEADFISVLNSYQLPLFLEHGLSVDCIGYELLSYMPNYRAIWRIQERRIDTPQVKERYRSFRLISEALGYSYDSPYLRLVEDAPLVSMPSPMQYRFQDCSNHALVPGYLLMYRPASNNANYAGIIRDLLCELADRGRFRNCELQVAAIVSSGLFLYVTERDFEYIFTLINKLLLLLKRKGNYRNVVINTAYKHLPVSATFEEVPKESGDGTASFQRDALMGDKKEVPPKTDSSTKCSFKNETSSAVEPSESTDDGAKSTTAYASDIGCDNNAGEPVPGQTHEKDIVVRDDKYPAGVCMIRINLLSPAWGDKPLLDSEGNIYEAAPGQLPF